jgi:release factor glutamine methyltransferase
VARVPVPPGGRRQLAADVAGRLRAAGCVFAEDEARLLIDAAASPEALHRMVGSRVTGTPLEYILGWAEFCGLRIAVEAGVFVPRRRTEFLVRQAIALASQRAGAAHAVVVELCCGSGAIGAAVLAALPHVELYAADIDPIAVRCARRNLANSRTKVFEGDLYDPLPARLRGRVDLLLANAPYVPTGAIGTMPPEARTHEPAVALDGGPDGLEVQRRIAADAESWLAPGGHLLVETSRHQAQQGLRIFRGSGLSARVMRSTRLDATVVVGTRPANA